MSGRIQQLKTEKNPQIVKCIFFTEALLFFILLSACSVNRNKRLSELDRDSIDFGVVITTESAYHSKILWFDSELEAAQEQELSYAALGSPFYVPVEDHGELFLIPQGLGNQKDTKKVIGVNKGSLEITEYPFQHIALNHMAAADDRVYAINTLNGVSCLEAWDKKINRVRRLSYQESIFIVYLPVIISYLSLICRRIQWIPTSILVQCTSIRAN